MQKLVCNAAVPHRTTLCYTWSRGHSCLPMPAALQGRRVCLRASSLSFSMAGAMRISLLHVWPSSLLYRCVHSLPCRVAAGIGTLGPLRLGHAALSNWLHMKKGGRLKPERAFFRILQSDSLPEKPLPTYILEMYSLYKKITCLVRKSADSIVSLAIKK